MTILAPIVVGFAVVAGLVIVAIAGAGLISRARLRKEAVRSERFREGGISSVDWAWNTPSAHAPTVATETPTVTLPVAPTVVEEHHRTVHAESLPSEHREDGEPVDNNAALRHAGQSASEIVAAAERTAARYEDAARRTAVAAIEEAERKADEIVAAAKRAAVESEDAIKGTGIATIEDAERKAAEIVAAAELRSAELEEAARRHEIALGEAPTAAGEIVAAAHRQAAELEQDARRRVEAASAEAAREALAIVETARSEAAEREANALRASESMLAEAQRKATEIVAQAEAERSRVLSGLAQERVMAEDMRRKLSALLDDVSGQESDDPSGMAATTSEPQQTLGARG